MQNVKERINNIIAEVDKHIDIYTQEKYPVWQLALSIALVTLGTYFFAVPLIQDVVILWIFVACLATFGLLLLSIGINNVRKERESKPKVVKEEKPKKEKKAKEEKTN